MRQDAIRVRAGVVRWLTVFSFVGILVALSIPYIRGFGGSSLVMNVAAADDGDWTYADHDISGTRYSALSQITPQNVNQLAKVCSYTFPEQVPSETAPLASGGILYATSDHYTVALDGANCHVLWSYECTPRNGDF